MGAQSMGRAGGEDTESVYSRATGASVGTAVTYATDMLGITSNTTFLLLDLRDSDEYQLWHIKEAINFPAANIARDKTIPELYRFKNAPDKLIICYMNDERQGTQQAALLAEKGYENTFLLSGGIEAFLEENTDLVEGRQVPVPRRQQEAEEERKAHEQKAARKAKH
jgi:centrosomal protein CEP41